MVEESVSLLALGVRALGAVCLAASLAACKATDEGIARVVDGCGVPHACNITERACQLAVLEVTACARGEQAPALPKIRKISAATYREELEALIAKADVMRGPWDSAFEALALQDPEMPVADAVVEERVDNILAYYEGKSQRITIIEGHDDGDRIAQMSTLAHEFTHYLQDLSEPKGLAGFRDEVGSTLDNQVAATALVEGEATVIANRVYAWLSAHSADELRWEAYFREWLDEVLARVADSPVPLYSAMSSLPYSVGGSHVHHTWTERGRDSVDDLFARPYAVFAPWLQAFQSSTYSQLVDPTDELACGPPDAPAGLVRYSSDSFGATGVLALLSRDVGGSPSTNVALAAQLRTDAILVYASSAEDDAAATPSSVAWRLRFQSAESAAAFAARATKALPAAATVEVFAEEVLITGSDSSEHAFAESARMSCPAPATLTPEPSASDSSSRSAWRRLRSHLVPRGGHI